MNKPIQPHSFSRRFAPATSVLIAGAFALGYWAGHPKSNGPRSREMGAGDGVAEVGGVSIPATRLEHTWISRGRPVLPDGGHRALLEEAIVRELKVAEALRLGLDRQDEAQESWRTLLIGHLEARREQASEMEISGEEIEAAYRANAPRFTIPERRRLALIRLPSLTTGTPERQTTVTALVERLHQQILTAPDPRATFAALARQFSNHHGSRFRDGDLGWIARDELASMLSAVACDAAWPRQGDPPLCAKVATAEAVVLVRTEGRQPAAIKPLADVREALRYELRRQRRIQIEQAWLAELRTKFLVIVHEDRLAALDWGSRPTSPIPPALPFAQMKVLP